MNTVRVRGVEIGAGKPKIAASITGNDRDAILAQATALCALPVDVAEWRMDHFDRVKDGSAVEACLRDLRRTLGNKVLLATFRSEKAGSAACPWNAMPPLTKLSLHRGRRTCWMWSFFPAARWCSG